MKSFFGNTLLLSTPEAGKIYASIKNLPIIDYHCHLDPRAIQEDRAFSDIGELWLAADHYKWRAMRLCGISEDYITGDKSYHEKFLAFASVMPKLIGNPIYYWCQMELSDIFGIRDPLNADTAESIWARANAILPALTAQSLLKKFKVQMVATTDDPLDSLEYHGDANGILLRPTFRPDKRFAEKLDKATLEKRLDFFVEKGCRAADHGFDFVNEESEDLEWLFRACYERNLVLQLHFGTMRNVNSTMFEKLGPDRGFDVVRSSIDIDALCRLFDKMNTKLGGMPKVVCYPLNDNFARTLSALSGAFPNITVGAAWWFNDTVCGIRRQLETVSEYAALGTQLGMLTDSRSLSSYVRFDFYRRILADFLGTKVRNGECDKDAAFALARDVSYGNVQKLFL